MKVTAIRQQAKRENRYSIYVDDAYSFSLSESALISSGLISGQELTVHEINQYKQLSSDDKLYGAALRYVAMRTRSTWEVQSYLERKGATAAFIKESLNKLSDIGLLDDTQYAKSYVHDRQLLRPTSRRKLVAELYKKRISQNIVEEVLGTDLHNETAALDELVTRKRRQSKYQDDQKLMQYLARQGFSYEDIKRALFKQ
jgi:regulatory protein